jgi:hypothetical protein
MSVSDLDIHCAAHQWIVQHGDLATAKAREMVERMRAKRDVDGADTWLRIIVAIGTLGPHRLIATTEKRPPKLGINGHCRCGRLSAPSASRQMLGVSSPMPGSSAPAHLRKHRESPAEPVPLLRIEIGDHGLELLLKRRLFGAIFGIAPRECDPDELGSRFDLGVRRRTA